MNQPAQHPDDTVEPPPPLGSWPKFYLLVAAIHLAVVTALIAFRSIYGVASLPR